MATVPPPCQRAEGVSHKGVQGRISMLELSLAVMILTELYSLPQVSPVSRWDSEDSVF